MSQQLRGYGFVILSAIGFATLAIFIKFGYQLGMTSEMLLTLRFLLASIIMVLLLTVRRCRNWRVDRAELIKLVGQGLFYFGCSYCFAKSANYLPASMTSILLYTYPSMVAILAGLFFKERMGLIRLTSLGLTFVGCLLVLNIFNQHFALNWRGLLFGLTAALVYAGYNLHGQHVVGDQEPLIVSTYVSVVCLAALVVLQPPVYLFNGSLKLTGWLVGLGMALLCTVIPVALYLKGISMVGASRAAIVSTIEPAVTILLAGLLLGERLSLVQISGGILIMAGVLILQLESRMAGNLEAG